MALSSGTKLGPYEIQSLVGAGGMGEVYRAKDARLDRTVAIKILPASFSADPDRMQRFAQEARAAAALNHPNILSIFDIGDEKGSPYVVSELLEGETLRERLRNGALSIRKAIEYGLQVSRGLAAAHEKGIVHRDLKPENLFITSDGRVKILDFGLAKLTRPEAVSGADAPTVHGVTEPGLIMGTAGYMSPEQVRGQAADPRSDIFAFGAILYEMLSGKRAFHGETSADTMSAILKEEVPELSETARNVPAGLERIVRHCLEKHPSQRFHSAGDLAFDLESLTEISATSSKSGAQAAVTQVRGEESRRKLFSVLGMIALAAAMIGLGWWLGRGGGCRRGARISANYVSHWIDWQRPLHSRRQRCLRRVLGRWSAPTISGSYRRSWLARIRNEECGPAFHLEERRTGNSAQHRLFRGVRPRRDAGQGPFERGNATRSVGQRPGCRLGRGRREHGGGAIRPGDRPLAAGISDRQSVVGQH